MASRQKQITSCIEVWVELCIGHGHAELFVDGTHYGFWAKSVGRGHGSSAYENRPSVVQRLNVEQFSLFYERFWRRSFAGQQRPRLRFSVYSLPATEKCKRNVLEYIKEVRESRRPYNPRGSGHSLNCVKFCVQALRRCGILPASFRFLETWPRPSDLDKALARLAKRRKRVGHHVATLDPTHFRRRNAKKR